jgi:hypothetical protein
MRSLLSASLLLLAVLSSLVACSSPPHSLRDNGQSRTFNVKLPSDAVYRKVAEGARNCYSKWEVSADFFPDNKTGRVSMSAKNSLSIHSLFMAEISPIEGGAKVQVFYLKGNPAFTEAVEAWTQGNYSLCPFA